MTGQSLEDLARKMRKRIFQHMLETRSWKYKAFLRYLRLFKYISFNPVRGEFLEAYYTLMRYIDDIVDGDLPVPKGYANGIAYLSDKIIFSENPENPKDEVDFPMQYCFELAKRFGEDFRSETRDILSSLLFDAHRRGKMIIFPEKELMHHFHLLDVRGTIKATLKIFKEDPEKYLFLEPLGMASRYQFDLEDFEADIKAGYINITREECDLLDISLEDIRDKDSPGVSRWLRFRAKKGLALLDEHHQKLPEGRFSFLARATFPLVYEFPARRLFKKILAEKEHLDRGSNSHIPLIVSK